MIKRWQVCTLDVWGNEEEGWDVNNVFTWKFINEEELYDMDAFLTEHLHGAPSDYDVIEDWEGFIAVDHKATGKPILQLRACYN